MESYAADLPAVTHNSTDNLTQPLSTNGAHHHHPPYSEMIIGAIAGLKDKDGSSRQAIAKYIDKVYGASNLPPTHANLLTQHLKRMKNEGQLIMVKHSYALPTTTTTNTTIETRSVPFEPQSTLTVQDYNVPDTTSPGTFVADKPQVRRKPGRPPKPKHEFGLQLPPPPTQIEPYQPQFEQQHQKEDLQSQTQTQTHLGQDDGAEPMFGSLGLVDEGVPPPLPQSAEVVKRRRGRPFKNASKPGRPKVNSNNSVNGGGVKRGRRKRIGGPVNVPFSTRTLRERPPKSATRYQDGGGGDADSRRPISRGRGRAPRNKFRSQSFGRPSQDESGTDIIVTDPQQLVAYQELKLKYEHLQSKTKQVVGVVRPYINPNYEAFGALQELETLAGTEVNVQTVT
ncbi:uncharacterized protein [Rutidosis leptorrhynchoides]|uniref:uncharacterized protein n=1 Tax=Rutidosis leptorrhynchoides TaxID=125765 RepID=UPI003A99D249